MGHLQFVGNKIAEFSLRARIMVKVGFSIGPRKPGGRLENVGPSKNSYKNDCSLRMDDKN